MVEPEEGRAVRTAKAPYVPSEQERREHAVTHFPPRSWCDCCVRGPGKAANHSQADGDQIGEVGELHFDYCFLCGSAGSDRATTLVGVDKYTNAVLAHVVPQKGLVFNGSRLSWIVTCASLAIMAVLF